MVLVNWSFLSLYFNVDRFILEKLIEKKIKMEVYIWIYIKCVCLKGCVIFD